MSRITGPSVVSKIGPCHGSQRPVSKRSNVWQCRKVKNWLKNRSFYSIYCLFCIFWPSRPSATPNRAQNSRNCQFWHCLVSKFSLCHSHRPFVLKCWTGPTCHSHRGVSNWTKWYSIKVSFLIIMCVLTVYVMQTKEPKQAQISMNEHQQVGTKWANERWYRHGRAGEWAQKRANNKLQQAQQTTVNIKPSHMYWQSFVIFKIPQLVCNCHIFIALFRIFQYICANVIFRPNVKQ
jgi:hypothetical protein